MNNDLEHLSEERLKEILSLAKTIQYGNGLFDVQEIIQIIRIALSAKQAKIAGFITSTGSLLENETQARANIEGTNKTYSPFYTTPQPAHSDQDGWIKCSERMPEENPEKQVLACFKGDDISTLYYFEGRWDDAYGIVPIRQDVTHWMPIPAAPKPESEL